MRQALELALEALEANYLLVNGTETHGGLEQCLDGYYSGCFDTDPINKQTEEAVTAIKEALAQPEQEPVAMKKHEPKIDLGKYAGTYGGYITPEPSESYSQKAYRLANELRSYLSIAPPQRTWVGLTIEDEYVRNYLWERGLVAVDENPNLRDEKSVWVGLTQDEQIELCNRAEKRQAYQGVPTFVALFQEVEAKLKEKNNGS